MNREAEQETMWWAWLCSSPLTYAGKRALLARFGHPKAIWQNREKLEIGENPGMAAFLQYCRHTAPEAIIHKIEEKGIHFIHSGSRDFPDRLRKIADPPYGLFVRGRLPDLGRPAVAIVGARSCSAYGRSAAEHLGRAFARSGVQVISGMAEGVDGLSQRAALEEAGEGITAAVLGCGVDVCYPACHRALYDELARRGGLISEYPCGEGPRKYYFPQRNRLISGLSDAVIVVEARKKSGSLITADFALEQGKDVYAVPGRVGDGPSEGCNRLIAQGAGVIYSFLEAPSLIFPALTRPKAKEKNHFALAPDEKLLYSCVDLHPQSLETLVEKSGLTVSRASRALFGLEEKGLTVEFSDGCYVRITEM